MSKTFKDRKGFNANKIEKKTKNPYNRTKKQSWMKQVCESMDNNYKFIY